MSVSTHFLHEAPGSHPHTIRVAPNGSGSVIKRSPLDPLIPCAFCGAVQLTRRHRNNFAQWLLSCISFYPYRCGKCFIRQTRFVPSFRLLLPVAFTLLAVLTMVTLNPARLQRFVRGGAASSSPAQDPDSFLRAKSSVGDLSPFERLMLAKKKQLLRNEDVIQVLRAGAEKPLVLKLIQTSNAAYDVTPTGIMSLKHAGVDDTVIMAMMERLAQNSLGLGQ